MAKGDMSKASGMAQQSPMMGMGGMGNSPFIGQQMAPQMGNGAGMGQQMPSAFGGLGAMFSQMGGQRPQSPTAPQGGFGGLMGGMGQMAGGIGNAMGMARGMPQQGMMQQPQQQQLPPQAAQPAQDNFASRYGSMMQGNTGISGGMNPGQQQLQPYQGGGGMGGGMGAFGGGLAGLFGNMGRGRY